MLAVAAAEGRVVDRQHHGDRRLVDLDVRQRPRALPLGEGLADAHLGEAGDGDDVPRTGLGDLHPPQPFVTVEQGDLDRSHATVETAERHLLRLAQAAVEDPPDGQPADVVVVVQVGDEELERRLRIEARRRHGAHDLREERLQQLVRTVRSTPAPSRASVAVEHRELELLLGGVEVDEEVEDLVQHLTRPRVRAVDLVDHHDRRQPRLQRLAQHEPRLRQRPFARVHQQQHAVHHLERPLHLAAEVGVAGRVHDVDADAAVVDGRVLGHDGDALLALEVDRVHHPLGHVLVLVEDAALPQHRVHQRGLAMVDVGDDGEVTHVVSGLHSQTVLFSRE